MDVSIAQCGELGDCFVPCSALIDREVLWYGPTLNLHLVLSLHALCIV